MKPVKNKNPVSPEPRRVLTCDFSCKSNLKT
jgi:hypothetical protein